MKRELALSLPEPHEDDTKKIKCMPRMFLNKATVHQLRMLIIQLIFKVIFFILNDIKKLCHNFHARHYQN